jgi:hypothetical protein
MAAPVLEPPAEVLGLDKTSIAAVGRAVIDAPQAFDGRPHDHVDPLIAVAV